ncbi:MAG: DUF3168 domain-containing protein [Pseudomonadota bacterium]
MSYALSAGLQSAIYSALSANGDLAALVGTAIYDAIPAGTLPALYVTLGPEAVRDASDKTGDGALHEVTITVVSETPAFAAAKSVAGIVCDILLQVNLVLPRGRVVWLNFEKAKAGRIDGAAGRKIDVTFKVRVEDD